MEQANIGPSEQDKSTQNQLVHILILLFERFKKQHWKGKLITLLFLILTAATIVLFFSTLMIWTLIKFLIAKVLLNVTEWYLHKTRDTSEPIEEP